MYKTRYKTGTPIDPNKNTIGIAVFLFPKIVWCSEEPKSGCGKYQKISQHVCEYQVIRIKQTNIILKYAHYRS